MARSYMCGFEMGHGNEAFSFSAAGSIQTATVRSGTYAFRCNLTSGTATATFRSRPAGGVLRAIFRSVRFYLRIASPPSANTYIYQNLAGGLTKDSIRLNADGTLSIDSDGAAGNSVSSAFALAADGLWHRLEFDVGFSAGNGRAIYVDGLLWATSSAGTTAVGDTASLGCTNTATVDMCFDDVLWDDSSLTSAGFPGDSKTVFLPVVSDNARGTWTGGAGGTTNLFAAMDNFPPAGLPVASETNTSQIKNITNTANQDAIFNCQSYSAAGIAAQDKINAVVPVWNDAEEAATGTKTGNCWISANPAQSAAPSQGSFDYGDDGGTCGTFPTLWATHLGLVTATPSVTVTTTPTVTIRAVSATTRARDCDFLGIYVDYTPGPIGEATILNQAVKRAAYY